MTPLRFTWVCIFSCSWVLSCASNPAIFDERLKNAAAARQRHDTSRQIQLLDAAFQVAKDENEMAEALYRKAHALLDQDQRAQGTSVLFRIALVHPSSDRAARAWLDLGRIYEQSSDGARAERCYLELLRRHPSAGNATAAAERIAQIRVGRGDPAHLTYSKLRSQTTDHRLAGALLYLEAAALQPHDPKGARRKFQELVDTFPLPDSPYSDEGTLRLALLLRAEDEPEQAWLLLSELQKHDRSASIVGSYTRRSYLDSYLLGAQILRDDLGRMDQAEVLLKRGLKKHAQSAIVDDLYFELLLVQKRRSLDTCSAFSAMLDAAPNSKYRRCGPQLCPSKPVQAQRAHELSTDHCADWIAHGSPLRTPLRTN